MTAGNGTYTALGQNLGNDIAAVTKYLTTKMDEQIVQESKTSVLTADPDLVQATSTAGTVKLGTIDGTGLGTYSKVLGYPKGGISLTFQEYTLRYDRALSATIDRRDTQITDSIAQAATALAWEIKHKVVPEVDATRMAVLFEKLAALNSANSNVVAEASPTKANVVGKIISGINHVRAVTGYDEGLTVLVNADLMDALDQSSEVTLNKDVANNNKAFNAMTRTINGQNLIYVPANRMATTVTLNDGFTNALTDGTDLTSIDKTKFGYAAGAKSIWFTVLAPGVGQAITAINSSKIIPKEVNQQYDGDTFYFRIFHDLIVPKNQAEAAYMSVQTGALGA